MKVSMSHTIFCSQDLVYSRPHVLTHINVKNVRNEKMPMSKTNKNENEKTLKRLATKSEKRMHVQRHLLMISERIRQCWTV